MEKIINLLVVLGALTSTHGIPVKDTSVTTRILNGDNAEENQFLYTVSIQLASNDTQPTRGHVCGGVLITYQHVLTAGSCTYTFNMATGVWVPIVASDYRVFAGSTLLTGDSSADRVRSIANYTVHPRYILPPAHFNDIAVITLTAAFPVGVVRPLSLPSYDFLPTDFTKCTVAGWGGSGFSPDTMSAQLLFSVKYIYNQDLCTKIHNGQLSATNIFPTMVCAASYNIISSGCIGDEGNALVCDGVLTGISFLTGKCQATSFPELYTRVSNYTSWIRTISGSDTFKPEAFILVAFTILHGFLLKINLN